MEFAYYAYKDTKKDRTLRYTFKYDPAIGLFCRIWQQRYVTRPLNSYRQLPLMLHSFAGNSSGQYLAAFRNKLPQPGNIFIVNPFGFI